MTIYPTITFEQWQFLNAAILDGRKKKPNPAIGVFGGIILGAAFSLLIVTPQTRIAGVVLGIAYAIFHNLFKFDYRKRLAASQRRSFSDMKPVLNGNRMDVDELGIRGTWVGGTAAYDFTWSAFSKRIDRQDALVFLYAPCCYIRVPTSGLRPESVQQIVSWFEEFKSTTVDAIRPDDHIPPPEM